MPVRNHINVAAIDKLLPQTQCTDCGYQGCQPYAAAIVAGDALDKCLPGGITVLKQLGELCNEDVSAFIPSMQEKAKPKRLAIIREAECIGCTKCIQACPVDAILGAAKQMHSVINSECTGCGLCVAPCPVDCIDLEITEDQTYASEYARQRYNERLLRLKKLQQTTKKPLSSLEAKKAAVAAALARFKNKKNDP